MDTDEAGKQHDQPSGQLRPAVYTRSVAASSRSPQPPPPRGQVMAEMIRCERCECHVFESRRGQTIDPSPVVPDGHKVAFNFVPRLRAYIASAAVRALGVGLPRAGGAEAMKWKRPAEATARAGRWGRSLGQASPILSPSSSIITGRPRSEASSMPASGTNSGSVTRQSPC
jgi:hypothetical protein